ncbi:MAG: hypothetical protein WCT31_03180 [Candidatus Micrarchaeia archaeon]|jgi:hypothetical protein
MLAHTLGNGKRSNSRPLAVDGFKAVSEILPLLRAKTIEFGPLHEIPLIMAEDYQDGFGDILPALKLAEGLASNFPGCKPALYVPEEAYAMFGRVYPNFDPKKSSNIVNGIAINKKTREREIPGPVHIFFALKLDAVSAGYAYFLGEAPINIYLEEYDAYRRTPLPGKLRLNTCYADSAGNVHVVANTGFRADALGIHIDRSLDGIQTAPDIGMRTELLKKILGGNDALNLERFVNANWGMAYHRPGDSYIKYAHLAGSGNPAKPSVLFEITQANMDYFPTIGCYRDLMETTAQVHVKNGNAVLLNPIKPMEQQGTIMLHIGIQPHDVFLRLLAQSDLPVCVMGDASAAEAITLGKMFTYYAVSWKEDFARNMMQLSKKLFGKKLGERVSKLMGAASDSCEMNDVIPRAYWENDPALQEAFREFGRYSRERMDIITKVSTLIRDGLALYEKHNGIRI